MLSPSDREHGSFWHEEDSQAVFLQVQKAWREERSKSNLLLQNVAGKLLHKSFPKCLDPKKLFCATGFTVLRLCVLGQCILAEQEQSACP